MTSPLFQAMSHRGMWVAVGATVAAIAAWRQAEQNRRRRTRQAEERSEDDREGAWAPLVEMRHEERLFERFRSVIKKNTEVELLDLLPEDEVGEVVETGRALGRLIHALEGEFDCALPPTRATERLSLDEWFRLIARNASPPHSADHLR